MEADENDTPETTGLMTETAIPALDADDGKTIAEIAPTLSESDALAADLDEFAQLKAQVQQQAEIINRMFTVLLAASTMPEQSSFARAFADRCGAILTGRQHVNASVV